MHILEVMLVFLVYFDVAFKNILKTFYIFKLTPSNYLKNLVNKCIKIVYF